MLSVLFMNAVSSTRRASETRPTTARSCGQKRVSSRGYGRRGGVSRDDGRRRAKTAVVVISIGPDGDCYLVGRVLLEHLDVDELDRIIGVLYEATERWFQPLVRMAYRKQEVLADTDKM